MDECQDMMCDGDELLAQQSIDNFLQTSSGQDRKKLIERARALNTTTWSRHFHDFTDNCLGIF